jgi:AraC-like DNA-binding protein
VTGQPGVAVKRSGKDPQTVPASQGRPAVMRPVRAGDPALVASGALPQLEALLGFPAWFRDGTGLGPANSPFPDAVTITDGMRMVVNICVNGAVPQVLASMIRAPRVLHSRGWAAGLGYAPTLGDALARIFDHFPGSNPYLHLLLDCQSGEACVQVAIDAIVPQVAHPYCGMGALLQIYRYVQPYGADARGDCVLEVATTATPELMALQGFLAAELRFGAAAYRLRFPQSWLHRPNPDFEPDLWRMLAPGSGGQAARQDTQAAMVRRVVRTALEGSQRPPALAEMARQAGLSQRTLVRRLTLAGTSYSRLIDSERRALAARLIVDPEVSLQKLADRLAFGDRQAFGRAFRGWFGKSPGRYRRRLLTPLALA